MEKIKKLTDTLLIAFLLCKGFQIKPIKNNNGKGKLISFEVIGDDIDKAIESFYENPEIPIMSFCNSYKTVRSMLFNLKGAIKNN